jgi:heme oxygenase
VKADLLFRLKRETEPQHEALERDLALLDNVVSLHSYRALLMRFYGFYRPWESALYPFLEEHLPGSTSGRSKLPLLADDLRHFGCDLTSLPAASVAAPDSLPAALGSMYVVEGSTLGGQLISRHLATALNLPSVSGRRFFFSYGENVGPMWRAFRGVLLAHSTVEADEIIIASARQTFISLHQWLCQTPR